ncbi:hypothetical protein CLD22_14580 [Rubrivivax gelatinosus]|nr:hypothetical protein [Rubrivivax gelatinosus]
MCGCGAVVCTLLAGCGSLPGPDAAPVCTAVGSRSHDAGELPAFTRQQRVQAEAALQQQRWADAAWTLEVLLTLDPGDPWAREQMARARSAIAAGVAERLPRAAQARQRGDLETATRLYLEILALAPGDDGAADALRTIERQRARNGNVAGFRPPGWSTGAYRRTPTPAARPPDDAERDARNEVEHAAMLAAQGDLDGAIATLKPLVLAGRAVNTTRSRLADLYGQLATRLEADGDRSGAIAALKSSLQLLPQQPRTAARLAALQAAARAGDNRRPPPVSTSR